MSIFKMRKQDLLELYQLCGLYRHVYGGNGEKLATELMEEIAWRYREDSGEEITKARNPRNAGRKKKYTDAVNEKILSLNRSGISKRNIAKEIGCSLGHVQDVIKEAKSN